jgi:hypothetical protein
VSTKKKAARRIMSDERQQAIADARRQNQVVRNYLNALTTAKPVRRRPSATREQLQEQIYAESDAVKRLMLIQPRPELEEPLVVEQGRLDAQGMQTNLSRWRLTIRPARASPRPPSKSSAFQPQCSRAREYPAPAVATERESQPPRWSGDDPRT